MSFCKESLLGVGVLSEEVTVPSFGLDGEILEEVSEELGPIYPVDRVSALVSPAPKIIKTAQTKMNLPEYLNIFYPQV